MDVVDDFLTGASEHDLFPAVKHALSLAKATLDRYYSRTDESNVYRIAMGERFLFMISL